MNLLKTMVVLLILFLVAVFLSIEVMTTSRVNSLKNYYLLNNKFYLTHDQSQGIINNSVKESGFEHKKDEHNIENYKVGW
ncbi:hypothetical protein HPG02_00445 [Pediococcus pentosaceus]|uniref:hypothetical protein n=1 Tax=Pediococcus pentosaceus TaxID=1255 RepID=UPI001C1ECD58|nr:hypothetical protein [Pediococcus pentosaceus]MBU7002106.1 hypothetical protein [Pediococcus pentosaceus]MCG9227402.1 hypothetical protein [Pediococcus pentosaceus]MDA8037461.1 hypothetical protein [Pediococcus pentosaceus]